MSKYIDAEKLKALIDEKWRELADKNVKAGGGKWDAEISTYLSVLRLITSLQHEQPEVDLEKELNQWRHGHFKGKRDEDYSGEYLERESQLAIARYFYELGKNARK